MLISALAIVAVLALVVWRASSSGTIADPSELLTERAVKGEFSHNVVERGELESSSNVEVRCEVRARGASGASGVKILEIVPEGTEVKQGDFLVKLDDSVLQDELTTQRINVSTAEALTAQAKNTLESSQIGKQEYEFGVFGQEEETLRGELFVAEENLSRAKESLRFTERLARRGYVAVSQLEADRFAVEKGKADVRIAQKKLEVLEKYTRIKTLKELDAAIKTAEALLKSEEAKLALEKHKLQVIEQQIAKCTIVAPVDGQVIYDHDQDIYRGADYQIKEGTVVNERRILIRLPDPQRMQVVAKVAESRIDLIEVGMRATITIEGLPGVTLTGKVTKVNEYPVSGNWYNSNVKEYAATIAVDDPPEGLRPGMTAETSIRVETVKDALQVPVQSVVEREGRHFCLVVKDESEIKACEILLGSSNEKFLVVRNGLSVNDEVLMNPKIFLPKVKLPEARLNPPTKSIRQHAGNVRPHAKPGPKVAANSGS